MLTIAYCRVSTEEQAAEGFSIDGQAEKLRTYAKLHDLGPVTVIEDPGRSGKNLDRPGLQQVLAMVEKGHVTNVLVWRLDRLSRDLGDLILLAEALSKHGVGLHSFTEKLDLSSATGRMFYNILGAFAQFYREQLAENVRMGMHQAARQGKWTNRPKFGYDLVGGELVPNAVAPTVRRIFELRAQGLSYPRIEELTGVKYSTARTIVCSRIYLGEVLLNGQWYAGHHEPIVSAKQFAAAQHRDVPLHRRSGHVLTGRVRCGLCGRVATIRHGREGRPLYRCRHRGEGCRQPSRSAVGLVHGVLLGLCLVAGDEARQEEIRRELKRALGGRPEDRRSRTGLPGSSVCPSVAGSSWSCITPTS
jgi:site-specific DNA recombinase